MTNTQAVKTVEELDTLKAGSVVVDASGEVYLRTLNDLSELTGRSVGMFRWVCQHGEYWASDEVIDEATLPLTVVYVPSEES